MTHLLRDAILRAHGKWTARNKFAALKRLLDAQALTELGIPPAQPKFHLWDWLSSKR